ncbi:MAG: hypothetical protein J6039_06500 [Alphaproteobacteria bacterium]|nr:hypothetical protein [Alphaproteobacteria bacterium]
MKSIFITFLLFIVVFSVAQSGVFGLLSHWSLHYGAFVLLAVIICCALYFVGLPKKTEKQSKKEEKDENK